MVSLAVPPYVLSRAIDDGLAAGDPAALARWTAAGFAVAVANAGSGIARHRTMTKVRMDAADRVIRATVHRSVYLGNSLTRTLGAGAVTTIGTADMQVIAQSLTITGPGVGAVIAYLVVAVVLLSISPPLALVVLAGVPLIIGLTMPLLRRIQQRGQGYREHQGALTERLADVLSGLRVLNGLGGKARYGARFHRESQALITRGERVGAVASWVDALATGLPTLFLALVTWLAARMAATGAISVGDLVAVYGYAAVLIVPVGFLIEGGSSVARGRVAADRVVRLLRLNNEHDNDAITDTPPETPAALRDPDSGAMAPPGLFTVLACAAPADGVAITDRLGRFALSDATWGGAEIDGVPLDAVRSRILVADNDAHLFTGSVREVVAGRHDADDERIRAAIHTAAADDIVDALPRGLDAVIGPGGHNLSGGQRQRLRLARALYAAPEVLLAVEPTSAVDAHTEARIADRLAADRRGATTVLATTSPIVLHRADLVCFVVDGRVAATGTHRRLLDTEPGYHRLVTRGDDTRVLR
ncbi:ABC-type multidrug transport system fused ATPase/permease subunit [Nocardia mexicana]|uniref:ABC-type multidrug transport system fused ATPase/permease subunit n=2 Tax=Nocardia mexicana TaxID=279262 RepID=A0A370H451_9NOCA|nr:ABC-type multidrug transport system fused ATPase/permease subunit [Nocardia mexicana]